MVKTKNGYKSIETIQSGDIVASANEHTGKISYKKVVQTFIRQTPRIYKLTYNDGTTVETTGDHPFFIQGKGWTNAESLASGDISPTWAGMQKSDGVVEKEIVFSAREGMVSDRVSSLVIKESLAVVDIEVIEEETTVYNFEVEDDHTYFVTEAEVWVHNADDKYSLSLGTGQLVLKYSRHGDKNEANFQEVHEDENGLKTYVDSATGEVVKIDKAGNVTRYYEDEHGNKIIDKFKHDPNFDVGSDKIKTNINGSDVVDGSLIKVNADGILEVSSNIEKGSILITNGQVNSLDNSLEMLQSHRGDCLGSSNCGGVYQVYNASNGLTDDTSNSISLQSLPDRLEGARTPEERNQILEAEYKREPALRTLVNTIETGNVRLLVGHSQGALLQGNALRIVSEQNRSATRNIFWVTAGGAHTEQTMPQQPNSIRGGVFVENAYDPFWRTGGASSSSTLNQNNITVRPISSGCSDPMQHSYSGCYNQTTGNLIRNNR